MKIPHSSIFGCLLVAGLFSSPGCSTKRTASGERIYFIQTAAYDQKVRTFALTEEQARDRVAEFVRTEQGTNAPQMIFIGHHMAIVGDCFVFSPPRKADVSLSGYYVDGHTGQVSSRRGGFTTLPLLRK